MGPDLVRQHGVPCDRWASIRLSSTGFGVCPVDPKGSDAWRNPSGAKTDRLDAATLSPLGWQERILRRIGQRLHDRPIRPDGPSPIPEPHARASGA